MKKRLLVSLALATLLSSSAYAVVTATPGQGVPNSVHDMNVVGDATNIVIGDEQGRICAFCHTPHHAIDPSSGNGYMPLWSHNLSNNTSYDQYASETFDAAKIGFVDQLAGPSRLCMSCHDGTVAPDQHYGKTATGGNKMFTSDVFPTDANFQIGIANGFGLSNDHPIGFSYDEVQAAEVATGANGLFAIDGTTVYKGTAKTVQDKFYGPTHIMTCATCHDVHNKDNFQNTLPVGSPLTQPKNYLVYADQNGSKLCLTCHDK